MITLTGTGLFYPEESITNEELVNSYNTYADHYNTVNGLQAGEPDYKPFSDTAFIEKASGIKSRFVIDKAGILDPDRMCPKLKPRIKGELSYQAEMAEAACRNALAEADLQASKIDCVIVACSNFERAYPAISIELQERLGTGGFAFDMNVACSSATFSLLQAESLIKSGQAKRVLIANPEICTAHLDFRNRDCHFIFGDATTAMVLEATQDKPGLELLGVKAATKFSTNIYNPLGFLTPNLEPKPESGLFSQEGRRVFKDVVPMAIKHIATHLAALDVSVDSVEQFWLHQANSHMNAMITQKLLGEAPTHERAPIILDKFANTSSAGSVIVMHQNKMRLRGGEYALLSSFGAGYSIGSAVFKKH